MSFSLVLLTSILKTPAMHIETFLYMLLQSEKTLPPPGAKPDFEALAHQARANSSPNKWVRVPWKQVTLGMNRDSGQWGWDNEHPVRTAAVPSFEAKSRPLTNGDYAKYLAESGRKAFPKSWAVESSAEPEQANISQKDLINGYSASVDQEFLSNKTVRTVYGPVPLILALDWPVMGSYDDLASCADWFGGRLPSVEEAHSIYEYAEELKAKDGKKGTHDDRSRSDALLNYCHTDLRGCNVSFKNFHPMPVTLEEDELAGRSGMGGAWEWTSTELMKWKGFKAMAEYPAYTGGSNFFLKHHRELLMDNSGFL